MKLNNKSTIALTILVLLCALLWLLTVNVTYSKIRQTNQTQNTKSQDSLKRQQLKKISTKLMQNNITIDDVLTVLPDNNNFMQFVDFIENAGVQNNAQVILDFDNSTQKGAKKSKITTGNKVEFIIQIIGGEEDVLNTIDQIENGKYFVEINKVDFISRSQDSTLANAKVEGNIYVKNGFKKQ